MAAQANGITIVEVDNTAKSVIAFVGSVDIRLKFQPRTGRFLETRRGYIDGRRVTERIGISAHQYRALMRQMHAIARDHGWKQ